MAQALRAPRGVLDVLPDDSHRWRWLEETLRGVAHAYACREIRFPTFEHTELFLRGVGDTTDVVQKEMYTFDDKGGRSLTLRPEGTASVVRAFIEHSLYAAGLPLKVYYMAPNFRYEKPQAGRLRQHHQFGVEMFGSPLPQADVELMALAHTYLTAVGLGGVIELQINSIGCPACRPDYHKALRAFLDAHKGDLCGLCLDRMARNPLRVLDCKNESCARVTADAPVSLDHLCDACVAHQEAVESGLTALAIPFVINRRIVRGLDYYTRTVFEFVTGCIGAQATLCGGGRYDGLVEALGGPPTPALGFGSGMERILLAVQSQEKQPAPPAGCDVYIATLGEPAQAFARTLAYRLRVQGLSVEQDTMGRSLKAQMKAADRIQSQYCLVIGEDEMQNRAAVLKSMAGGAPVCVALTPEDILQKLKGEVL